MVNTDAAFPNSTLAKLRTKLEFATGFKADQTFTGTSGVNTLTERNFTPLKFGDGFKALMKEASTADFKGKWFLDYCQFDKA